MTTCEAVNFKQIPNGFPNPKTDFDLVQVPIPSEVPEGHVKLETVYVSVDPYMRGRMDGNRESYIEPFELGKPITGFCVCKVLESKHPDYPVGAHVSGFYPWQRIFIHKPNPMDHLIKDSAIPLSYYIGVLGMPGMTAWLGLMKCCKPQEGETLFVTAASGAVGSLVCQLGKMKGLRVVACAGSDDKVKALSEELGVDAAFNYKTCENYTSKLKEVCPNGIDCYFDNVGGEMLDAVLLNMNKFGRIAICGAMSQYNIAKGETAYALKYPTMILIKELTVTGFIVSSLTKKYGNEEAIKDYSAALKSGVLKYRIDEADGGFARAPEVLVRMLKGENHGKQVVKI